MASRIAAVVVPQFLHGYRYREIAAILGLRERTVARRLSRALAQMRRLRSRIDEGDDGERSQSGAR